VLVTNKFTVPVRWTVKPPSYGTRTLRNSSAKFLPDTATLMTTSKWTCSHNFLGIHLTQSQLHIVARRLLACDIFPRLSLVLTRFGYQWRLWDAPLTVIVLWYLEFSTFPQTAEIVFVWRWLWTHTRRRCYTVGSSTRIQQWRLGYNRPCTNIEELPQFMHLYLINGTVITEYAIQSSHGRPPARVRVRANITSSLKNKASQTSKKR